MTIAYTMMDDFRDRQVWREARLLAAAAHQLTASFPRGEATKIRTACISLLVALSVPRECAARGRSSAQRSTTRILAHLTRALKEGRLEHASFQSYREEARLVLRLLNRMPER